MSSHSDGQDVASAIYLRARQRMLAALSKRLGELDVIYGQDAKAIKAEISAMLRLSVSEKRVGASVTRIMAASRDKRLAVLEGAVKDGALLARDVDAATYHAVFDGKPGAPPPKARRVSASSPTRTPLLRLVRGSAGTSHETG